MSRKALVVARTEYLKSVRTKAFVIGVLLMPLLFGGGILAAAIGKRAVDTRERHFAVVDRGDGALWQALRDAAERRNREELFDREVPGKQVAPAWVPERREQGPAETDEELELALSERVDRDDLFGFLVLGRDLATLPPADPGQAAGLDLAFAWQTGTPTYGELPDWIASVVNDAVHGQRFAQAGLDRALVDRATSRLWLREMGLSRLDAKGELVEASDSDKLATIAVPAILTFLLFMLVMSTAPALLNTVLEEKMQKIAEVLVGSVAPFDLMLGKLLGALCTALTLAVIYVGAGLAFLHVADVPPQVVAAIGPAQLAWFTFFLVMALLIYGSIFAAMGAACTEMQDAQSLMGPVMLVVILPVMFFGPIIQSPDGPLARALSLFPPATPTVMLLRVNMPPGPAAWEVALSVVLVVLFTTFCVWAGSKVFRIGILSQGQAPSWRRLVRWVLTK